MAHYLVRAKPKDNLAALRARLDAREIETLRPFGSEMQQVLQAARLDSEGWALWEETCYCSPPLKQERAVLDLYFDELTTTIVNQGEGWQQITGLSPLWEDSD